MTRLVDEPPGASALMNSSLTSDHASALHRSCSITRRTRLMRSQGCHEPDQPHGHLLGEGWLAVYGASGISTRVLFVTTRSRRSTGADWRGDIVTE